MIEQIRELTNLPEVSGLEDQVRNYIHNLIKNLGEVTIDNLGNLILKVSEGNEEILITPHMDEVGLLVTNIERDGKIRFRKICGIDDRVLPNQQVIIHADKGDIHGIIGIIPLHLQLNRKVNVTSWY